MSPHPLPLEDVLPILENLAPPALAEEWDNVGLLVEPPTVRPIGRILLTINLSQAVVAEARDTGADMIIAYHPPVFIPLPRLCYRDPGSRAVLDALQAGLAVYSPHTALDTVAGGVNDWLADGLGPGRREPLVPGEQPDTGTGRRVMLDHPLPLPEVSRRIREHLGIDSLRIAGADDALVETVALCAGAGGSVLAGAEADVYFTGEMRHHDVLAARARGTRVILCEHTHTERGYLPVYKKKLDAALEKGMHIAVSQADREPLESV